MAVESRVQGRATTAPAWRFVADYVSLLKPGVILLLVVTELAAMIMAARGLPRLEALVGAVLGGAMSAGGAGAVNCWFDRDIDALMPRTRRRPIPSGRVSPVTGLGFGVGVFAAGVVLIAVATNVVAAGLAAAGGLFYVFVYTMWLKRSTTQNIVIGGIAGAFPPLVGWAAVTGSLSPLAWAMFAIIFFWTPPHFWALALLLRRQYAAVNVPMLPSVSGSRHTRRAIVAYTVVMTAVSLVPSVWLGPLYAIAAAGLGAAFLGLALVAVRREDGRSAMTLFHYSLIYLALIFASAAFVAAVPL